ncbi:restriction endonuclease subunit S [Enterococcus faecalis]|jgi:type I restriction enzyme S subunit|uniref:restriction endonuclease subunit S n=1 Tax=Enterococcus faecalis TaxID=1351 RepID=UPI0003A7BE44|nr:restriction endonuclease subunit S [Enterococcus faecalis]EGO7922471.1 restriction endonuclease subunit S [Enterococcus faecalis]EGO9406605.1 restriction endonuclease subunit S [Enterococcus faecalis]EGS8308680.1 restriction endonuclease subunit S [Enterococcus faecalis]EHF1121105.1 restriction endonuclease subunit S [Enterococcus faecalis]EKE4875424.1 restriction endonuclease subunit S [Enterococcus faecalis]
MKKVPRLRFRGFSEDWELCKLGDCSEILTGGTPKTSISEYWEPKKIPWMSSGEVNKRRLDKTDNMISEEGLDNSSARWIKKHSVLIALAGQGKTRGTVAVNNINLTTNQSIAAIVPNDNLHYEFIYQNLTKRYDELRMISSGDGTRGGLNKQIVSDVIILSPSKEEQIRIGAFFKRLDYAITLHQRKLDQLKELKKAYLQVMFPEKDEIVPRMRFVDFEGEWELCKLGDVANRYDNLRVPITASKRISGNTPYYGANGIQDFVEGYTHDGEFILVAEDGANDLKDYPVQYVNGKVWVNNHAHVLQAKQSIANNKFLMNAIKNINIELFLVGGSRAKLNADIMMKLEINMPVKNEQIRVSEFCTQLDNIITIYQNKLNQLKSLKKSYLQNMFI